MFLKKQVDRKNKCKCIVEAFKMQSKMLIDYVEQY